MRQHDVERRCKAPDRTEVFLQIVAEIFVKRLAERVVGVGLKDRVAVRNGLRCGCCGDRSARPGAVHHDDRLPQVFGQRLRHDAPDDVRRTARRTRHDVVDRPVGIRLGMAVARQHQSRKGCQTRRDGTTPVGRRIVISRHDCARLNGHEIFHLSNRSARAVAAAAPGIQSAASLVAAGKRRLVRIVDQSGWVSLTVSLKLRLASLRRASSVSAYAYRATYSARSLPLKGGGSGWGFVCWHRYTPTRRAALADLPLSGGGKQAPEFLVTQ